MMNKILGSHGLCVLLRRIWICYRRVILLSYNKCFEARCSGGKVRELHLLHNFSSLMPLSQVYYVKTYVEVVSIGPSFNDDL